MLEGMSNLAQRVTISSFVTLLVWMIIYFSKDFPFLFLLLIAATISTALIEFYRILKAKDFSPLTRIAIGCSVLFTIAVYYSSIAPERAELYPQIVLLITLAAIFGYYFVRGSNPIVNIAMTLFGIAYLTLPLSYLLKVNYFFSVESFQDGRCWLIYLLFVTKMTDTGAYFFGKSYGRRPLAKQISPRKTIEGAIGGLFTSIAFSAFFYVLAYNLPQFWRMKISFGESLWLGAAISLAAQFGDLAESLLKRDGDVKDSNTLPGLGGVLDIVDSMIFTAPLLYLYLKIFVN